MPKCGNGEKSRRTSHKFKDGVHLEYVGLWQAVKFDPRSHVECYYNGEFVFR